MNNTKHTPMTCDCRDGVQSSADPAALYTLLSTLTVACLQTVADLSYVETFAPSGADLDRRALTSALIRDRFGAK